MRLRDREPDSGLPRHLELFTPDDWPGATRQQQYKAWCSARIDHARLYGWPGGPLACLLESRRVREELFPSFRSARRDVRRP